MVWLPEVEVHSVDPTMVYPLPSIVNSFAITIGFVTVILFCTLIVAPESALAIALSKDSSSVTGVAALLKTGIPTKIANTIKKSIVKFFVLFIFSPPYLKFIFPIFYSFIYNFLFNFFQK